MISVCLTILLSYPIFFFFFFNDTATTEIYTLSLHDALPISSRATGRPPRASPRGRPRVPRSAWGCGRRDRKSTRLNSSHLGISYAVFCLKKKKKKDPNTTNRVFANCRGQIYSRFSYDRSIGG